jgi:hypothetical protein
LFYEQQPEHRKHYGNLKSFGRKPGALFAAQDGKKAFTIPHTNDIHSALLELLNIAEDK